MSNRDNHYTSVKRRKRDKEWLEKNLFMFEINSFYPLGRIIHVKNTNNNYYIHPEFIIKLWQKNYYELISQRRWLTILEHKEMGEEIVLF